jgi:hypothetical protein
MAKLVLPSGWVHQAYRFEVDRPTKTPAISSHAGRKRYAWNWALGIIEEQLRAKDVFRVIALRQGATMEEAEAFAIQAATIPALVEQNEQRRKTHEAKVVAGARTPGAFHPVSEWCPWSKEAMRFLWNRTKDNLAPWWEENSKETYSCAFEALDQALKNRFDSRSGERKGAEVGWPRYKSSSSRQSVSFTTGAIKVTDRHHVQLPQVGTLRVKEGTDKLRLPIKAGTARILRATLGTEGPKTYVSFAVVVKHDTPARPSKELADTMSGYTPSSRPSTGTSSTIRERRRPNASASAATSGSWIASIGPPARPVSARTAPTEPVLATGRIVPGGQARTRPAWPRPTPERRVSAKTPSIKRATGRPPPSLSTWSRT